MDLVLGRICLGAKPATLDNPLQAAHLIPFGVGIIRFWLTLDWLDGPHNLIWAHKLTCNKEAEIPTSRIVEYLKQKFGIEIPKHVDVWLKLTLREACDQMDHPGKDAGQDSAALRRTPLPDSANSAG
jgi:hypothetical protein